MTALESGPSASRRSPIDRFESASSSLPPTAQLLLQGGDARIALEANGSNRYGCAPAPDPSLLAFGSSTASTISESGFAAAECLRQRLISTGLKSPADIYEQEIGRVRNELIHLCGLSGMTGLELVFGASGTDLHLFAAQLARSGDTPLRIIMIDQDETGKGVPFALEGRHFSSRSARGELVAEGSRFPSAGTTEVRQLAVRQSDGMPRAATAIDAEVEALASEAIAAGQRVLLILTDMSKTGLIAPSPGVAAALCKRFPQALDVLVDACQFRIGPPTLRAYLEHGFMVAVTGSKFLTGPTFAGALFVPAPMAIGIRERSLPGTVGLYSCRTDWPRNWRAAADLDHAANFGLLLRWEAALAELRAFHAIPEEQTAQLLQTIAETIGKRLENDPLFAPLPVPALQRDPPDTPRWDGIQTIFPFLLMQPGDSKTKTPLCREQTLRVYQMMRTDLSGACVPSIDPGLAALRCQLGQPVVCGERQGSAVSALRICISSRLIVEAASQGSQEVIAKAMAVLDKAAILTRMESQ